jgi:hypothetical protein
MNFSRKVLIVLFSGLETNPAKMSGKEARPQITAAVLRQADTTRYAGLLSRTGIICAGKPRGNSRLG